jgi:hypothetical protein
VDAPQCAVCACAAEHGWYGNTLPRGQAHCRDCHVSWPGGNRHGHCAACHRTFAGIAAFDAHQATKNGEISDSCLCSASDTKAAKESTGDRPDKLSWKISTSVTLETVQAKFGVCWRRRRDTDDLADVFGTGTGSKQRTPAEVHAA